MILAPGPPPFDWDPRCWWEVAAGGFLNAVTEHRARRRVATAAVAVAKVKTGSDRRISQIHLGVLRDRHSNSNLWDFQGMRCASLFNDSWEGIYLSKKWWYKSKFDMVEIWENVRNSIRCETWENTVHFNQTWKVLSKSENAQRQTLRIKWKEMLKHWKTKTFYYKCLSLRHRCEVSK